LVDLQIKDSDSVCIDLLLVDLIFKLLLDMGMWFGYNSSLVEKKKKKTYLLFHRVDSKLM
jgi:hypothetical protein